VNATTDVVVVGAGIVGAACAEALSREGLRVTIVESGVVAGGATGAGMGHITVMDDSEAQFALTRYSRELWSGIAPSLPADVEFDMCGTLWLAADEEEMAVVRAKHQSHAARDVRTEILDATALREAEPNLRPGLAGALLVPEDSVIYGPCAARWLIERAVERGGSLRAGTAVVEVCDGGVTLADGTRIAAARTVCATGTWAVELFPGLAVRPRKGHLAITDRYPGFVRHELVELGYLKSAHGFAAESVACNIQPRITGQVLIGSSRQFGATHPEVDAPVLRRMLERAIEYVPALAGLSVIRTWTGFRAATDDKLPVIGPCPGRPGVYLATGHEGLGLTTSLGTAQLVADLMAGRTPSIAPEPYLPSRMMTGRSNA
jgi:glycine/D-amino acid oxidase-like deaminating enzyme